MKKDIENLIKGIEKGFGKGSILKLSGDKVDNVETISTGSLLLDEALGAGGYPVGRIVEIYGPESSGKTTMALTAISEAQKNGLQCAFIDAEHAISTKHAAALGVKLDDLIISQPDSGEQALELVDHLIASKQVDLIVVDSVAALVPKQELEGDMEDSTIALQARMMSKALRKISGTMNKTKTTVIFINQIREKVGVIFGNPEVTPGGRALKFYASVRLDIRLRERLKDGDKFIGQKVKIKVVKNKVASPFQEVEPTIYYASGIDKVSELIDLAVADDIVQKSGSWYSYNGEQLAQGKVETARIITEHNMFDEIYEKVFNQDKTKIDIKEEVEEEVLEAKEETSKKKKKEKTKK